MEHLNQSLFLTMNVGDHAPTLSIMLAMVLAEWTILAVPVFLVAQWLWGAESDRRKALICATTIGAALLVNQSITLGWHHPRPFMIGLGHTLLPHAAEPSFPSDHATVFFTFGLSLWRLGKPVPGSLFAIGGLLAGWSRVYLGVHFPLDIVGALLVSAVAAAVVPGMLGRLSFFDRVYRIAERLYRLTFAPTISRGWTRN